MLSDIIAVIALTLSIISLYWQWKERRPRLRINPSIEIKPLPIVRDGTGGFSLQDTVTLNIYLANPSEKAVHITAIYLGLQKGKLLQLDGSHALEQGKFSPFTIEPLRGYTFAIWGKKLAKILHENGFNGKVQAKIVVQDEVHKLHTSKTVRFSTQQLVDDNLHPKMSTNHGV